MRRWLDTLFARVVLVQVGIALLVTGLFGVLALRQQAQTLARVTAPLWAAALAPAAQQGWQVPYDVAVTTQVQLVPGPPPKDGIRLVIYPRYKTLAAELRAHGLPVQEIKVSGHTGEAITWLALGEAGQTRWVGIRGEFEGIDARARGTLGLSIGLVAILLAAWWLSGRVLRPVAELRRAMQRFKADGQLPAPVAGSAPIELRELAQQFEDLARERRALDEQRRSMLAAISHDLRSPLGRIRMAAELLPESAGVAPRRETIVRNVQVADRLLGSFIDMARAEDEALDAEVALCALVREVAHGEADVVLARLPDSEVWLGHASALGLERALRNLLDNARRHGAPPIVLGLELDGQDAVLWVRDHGPGIAPEQQAEMLRPFARGEASRQVPGTGLGLSIAQRTAARHGGRLVLSDAAPGLRIELRLPQMPGETA